jgi:hypothetical protein
LQLAPLVVLVSRLTSFDFLVKSLFSFFLFSVALQQPLAAAAQTRILNDNLQVGASAVDKSVAVPAELAKTIPSLKLKDKDGTVLKNAQLFSFNRESVSVRYSGGNINVPYEYFPSELQAALARVRPAAPPVKVSGPPGTLIDAAEPINLSGPATAPKKIYPGRITMPGSTKAGTPIPDVLVSALSPAAYAIYNRDRLAKSGAEIDRAYDKLMAAAKGTVAQRNAARDDYLLSLYVSFEPPVAPLGTARTEANGSFNLECDTAKVPADGVVVLIARASLPAPTGEGFVYVVWVMGANPSTPTFLDIDNQFLQTR